ncbi:MAG TPA: acyl-CoA dehydrogenase [Deltaproteobacteria bacterium]|nr:acyl-CoA dehydrogenase [Deltaproteobacteria bacterium]
MDFKLSATERDIQQAAREFAEKEFPDVAREYDEKEEFPMPVWKKACELGFVGGFIKEEYGGPGLGFTGSAMIMEEFWRVDPGMGNLLLTSFGSEIIQNFGTEEQKKKYLPLIPPGKAITCCAVTEPDAGSDVLMASTTAVRDGDEYVINGGKMFITNGSIADLAVVFCLTDQKSGDRYKRHSFFIVEKGRKGFEASQLKRKMGIRASDTSELSFNNVRVPAENLIGGRENDGFKQVMYLFNINRLVAAAQGVGVAQGAFEKAVQYIKQRRQFGKAIASFQGVQFMVAEMAANIEVARNTLYKACWMIDQGKFDPMIISIAKLFAGKIAVSVTNDALQLHGAYGYLGEYDISRFYRDAKVVEIYEGTREIEKLTIAREILGRA